MGDIVEFEDEFDNVTETTDMTTILETLDTVLNSLSPSNAAVVFDINTFTKPYTKQVDTEAYSVYEKAVARGFVPIVLSWEEDSTEKAGAEREKLTSYGVSPDAALILRDPEACPCHKKGMTFSTSVCEYTRERASGSGYDNVMYVGRMWLDVLPSDMDPDAIPSTSPDQHLLCRHINSGVWSLRISPSKF